MNSPTSDSMYRFLVQSVTDYAIYMLTPDGIVSNWNAGAEIAKGYRAEEITGQNFSVFYTEQDRLNGLPQRALETARNSGKFEGEGWRVRKDGTRFWAHVVLHPIHDDSGDMVGFAKITRDVTAQREAERIATEQERNFKLLVQGVTDYAIYMLTPDGTVSNWNAGAERAKGYHADEIIGQHFSRFYTPEDRRKGLPERALARALAKGKFEGEGWRVRRDGSRFWAHVVIDPIYGPANIPVNRPANGPDNRPANGPDNRPANSPDNGQGRHLVGFAKITRDLSEQKKQMDQASFARENFRLALGNMSQGLCLFDESEQLLLANTRFQQILGLTPGSVEPGATFVDLLWAVYADDADDPEVTAEMVRRQRLDHLAALAQSSGIVNTELLYRGRNVAISHRALPNGGWVSTLDDVTDRRRFEERLDHLAHYDALTELANRTAFRRKVDDALMRKSPFALLHLDLDQFKSINDTLGPPMGDGVLQIAAGRIASQLRKNDVGSRLGSDEFAILLADCETPEDAVGVADRLIRDISRPMRVNDIALHLGASVGIAFSPQHGVDCDLLLRNAGLALSAAKQGGGNCHRSFEQDMERTLQERQELERDLRLALANQQFCLHYQPVVDTRRNTVTGFEALLRWNSPTRGRVAPVDFIPFAEELGLMPQIGEWVLKAACEDARHWPPHVVLSVNLSVTQLQLPDLVERITALLEDNRFPPERLELEVTETAMITDLAGAKVMLKRLRAYGILIALDDFGTGYSSLSLLRELPFTRIKIDRSFVQDLGTSPEATAIVRAVIRLCQSLGVSTTAEGIETEQQLQILESEHCPEIQGYLMSPPLPSANVAHWLSQFESTRPGKPDFSPGRLKRHRNQAGGSEDNRAKRQSRPRLIP